MEITKHFTATVLIINENKCLLHFHKKLNIWLPVGGHIERDELPTVAALREVKEEAGLDVKLLSLNDNLHKSKNVQELVRPEHIFLEDINPFHQHIDFVYYAKVNTFDIPKSASEYDTLKWFDLDELEQTENMPEDMKYIFQRALKLYGEK